MKVIITGASRGLGFSMAEAFAGEGHDLYLTARNEVTLYHALESLMGRFPDQTIKARAFDLGSKEGALGFGNWILQQGVEPDILINNAGTFEPGRVIDEPEGQLEKYASCEFIERLSFDQSTCPVYDET